MYSLIKQNQYSTINIETLLYTQKKKKISKNEGFQKIGGWEGEYIQEINIYLKQ